jgi:dephospho-CoA kinase
MRVIGLTGGVACGKSTVAAMLRDLGAEVVDADEIAREVVEPGRPALAEIVAEFGRDVLGADGRLNRKRLGERVFADEAARHRLERITHPRIVEEGRRRLEELRARGVTVAVYEAALLVETGRHRDFDALVVVVADEEEQRRRLTARDGLSLAEARRRLAAQLPASSKTAVADHVIRCQGPLGDVRRRVEEVWRAVAPGPYTPPSP